MRPIKKLFLVLVITIPLAFFVFCDSQKSPTKSNPLTGFTVRFINKIPDHKDLNVQITKCQHIRGKKSIFKNMDEYVEKDAFILLPNLIDGGKGNFKSDDIIYVTFECFRVYWWQKYGERAEVVVEKDIDIVAVGDCSYVLE